MERTLSPSQSVRSGPERVAAPERSVVAFDPADAAVLLVDDHPANLVALEAILEPLGHTLVRAGSGEEALRALLAQDFALILMDVQMPGMDGFETARLIKNRKRSRDTPIIFLTAINRDAAHVFEGYSHGAVDYLLKPFDPVVLRSKVSVFVELYAKSELIRRQAELLREAELAAHERRSELRFQALTEAMPLALWVTDAEGHILYRNRTAIESFGSGDPVARPRQGPLASVHADDDARVQAAWTEALRTGEALQLRARLRREDDEHRWHLLRARPELEEPGERPVRWIVTAVDVHDAEEHRQELAEFKATLDATQDAVFIFDEDLRMQYVNQGAVDHLGYPREVLLGMRLTDIDAERDEAALRALHRELRQGAAAATVVSHVRRADGSQLHAEIVVQYVPGERGGRFVSIARDVTERERAQAALREASEAKDAFLAAASHELRTPLQAAKGYAHLAVARSSEPPDSPPGKAIRMVMRQVDRMAKLVEDLLDISRIQSGRLALETSRFALDALVREAVERTQVASGTRHRIDLDLAPGLEVEADRGRVDQVVTNLVSNAIRYSPDGGTIALRLAAEDDGVLLEVRDEGVGIPSGKQSEIFERFARAHGSSYGGLGLGLTIAQGIVAQHGGRIGVESTGVPGRGSTFRVWLPVRAPGASPA